MILSGDFQSKATAPWCVAIFASNDDAKGTRAHHALDVVNLVDLRVLIIQKFVLLFVAVIVFGAQHKIPDVVDVEVVAHEHFDPLRVVLFVCVCLD